MTNLNLNIAISEHGFMMADIFILSGINPDSKDREILGIFSDRNIAVKQKDFWSSVMDYQDVNIQFQILRLN